MPDRSFIRCSFVRLFIFIVFHFLLVVRGRDPSAVAVLVEDGAAVAGLLIAASCLGLTSYTGNAVYDALGSIAIGGKQQTLKESFYFKLASIYIQVLYWDILY